MLLKKSLYGTRKAARCWWIFFKEILADLGFDGDSIEQTVYIYWKGEKVVAIWLHVDDGLVVANDVEVLASLWERMASKVQLKWDEKCNRIVGINLNKQNGDFLLDQMLLAKQIVSKWELLGQHRLVLSATTLPDIPLVTNDSSNAIDVQLYQSYVGSINYLALGTRPDLSFAINYLSRFSKSPDAQHWAALEHLVRYISLTIG